MEYAASGHASESCVRMSLKHKWTKQNTKEREILKIWTDVEEEVRSQNEIHF